MAEGREPVQATNCAFSTNDAVKQTVSSVVDNVANITRKEEQHRKSILAAKALEAEKERVQKLINGLVRNVANGGGKNSSVTDSTSSNPQSTDATNGTHSSPNVVDKVKKNSANRSSIDDHGVPLGDHRVFHIRGTPMSWSQSHDSLTIIVKVPAWVRKEHIIVKLDPGAFSLCVGMSPDVAPVMDIKLNLFGGIDVDSSMWMLEGVSTGRSITLELDKGRVRWWDRLFMDDNPANYIPVDSLKDAIAAESPVPGSPLSPETDSPPPPPPPADLGYSSYVEGRDIPPPPDHPPPESVLPPTKFSGSEKSVEGAVEEIVDELVSSVVSNTVSAKKRVESEGDEEDEISASITPITPKTLTVDDIKRMMEKNIAEVEANGPLATSAACQVGMVYWHAPYGMERDARLAVKYLEYGLSHGDPNKNAAFHLGMIYNSGAEGVEADPSRAVKWWTVAALLEHPVAMFNLAVMKMNGNGCDMDPIGAMQLFARANMLSPRLRVPVLPQELMVERIALAERQRIEKAKREMTPEEREARREAALQDIRYMAYGTGAVAALSVGLFALRHWWRNTL